MSKQSLRKRLEGISKCSINGERAKNLYQLLVNKPEIWELAYANICANDGATTKGIDGVTADGHSVERSREIMNQLRNGTYRPKPTRRVYIPKSNGKQRPLGIPTFTDKLVQEACRIILEAIYEPVFSKFSFGFRKGMGCHEALQDTSYRFNGTKWFIEFDIKGYFDNIDHRILVGLLKKKINDERFTALIGWMLNAGYMEDWKFNKTYSGTPQGGVVSPILANIYLHELDVFMAELCQRTHKGKGIKMRPEYKLLDNQATRLRKQLELVNSKGLAKVPEIIRPQGGGKPFKYEGWTRDDLVEELERIKSEKLGTRVTDQQDPNYRRLQYTRYADDFLLGFIGSKAEAGAIMEEVKGFLQTTLLLECSEEKTKIVHHSKGVIFLGYKLSTYDLKADADRARWVNSRVKKRTRNSAGIILEVPVEKVRDFIKRKRYGNLNNRSDWEALHRAELLNNSDYEILAQYKAEMRGFAEYYKLAGNFHKGLGLLHYIAQTSLVKTLASKHKISVAKVYQRYTDGEDKRLTVVNGKYKSEWFKLKDINRDARTRGVDMVYNHMHHSRRSEIVERLNAEECEYCGKTGGYFEVHHVRKMVDIGGGKELWQRVMIARNRKKLVVCIECHHLLHAGKLPDFRFKAKSA